MAWWRRPLSGFRDIGVTWVTLVNASVGFLRRQAYTYTRGSRVGVRIVEVVDSPLCLSTFVYTSIFVSSFCFVTVGASFLA